VSTLVKRVVREKRRMVLPLAIALLANIAAYAFIVYPLGVRSATAAERAVAAATAREAAERELAVARALVEGKARADEDLNAFYQKVLPANLTAARRMTYASLPALAERTDVEYLRRSSEVEEVEKDKHLSRLTIRVVLQGEYDNIRDFIYQLESAPEFVIIDDVTLMQGGANEPQSLTINLSTYFRVAGNGV
jgi:Tfp pilus assembly protein PilO